MKIYIAILFFVGFAFFAYASKDGEPWWAKKGSKAKPSDKADKNKKQKLEPEKKEWWENSKNRKELKPITTRPKLPDLKIDKPEEKKKDVVDITSSPEKSRKDRRSEKVKSFPTPPIKPKAPPKAPEAAGTKEVQPKKDKKSITQPPKKRNRPGRRETREEGINQSLIHDLIQPGKKEEEKASEPVIKPSRRPVKIIEPPAIKPSITADKIDKNKKEEAPIIKPVITPNKTIADKKVDDPVIKPSVTPNKVIGETKTKEPVIKPTINKDKVITDKKKEEPIIKPSINKDKVIADKKDNKPTTKIVKKEEPTKSIEKETNKTIIGSEVWKPLHQRDGKDNVVIKDDRSFLEKVVENSKKQSQLEEAKEKQSKKEETAKDGSIGNVIKNLFVPKETDKKEEKTTVTKTEEKSSNKENDRTLGKVFKDIFAPRKGEKKPVVSKTETKTEDKTSPKEIAESKEKDRTAEKVIKNLFVPSDVKNENRRAEFADNKTEAKRTDKKENKKSFTQVFKNLLSSKETKEDSTTNKPSRKESKREVDENKAIIHGLVIGNPQTEEKERPVIKKETIGKVVDTSSTPKLIAKENKKPLQKEEEKEKESYVILKKHDIVHGLVLQQDLEEEKEDVNTPNLKERFNRIDQEDKIKKENKKKVVTAKAPAKRSTDEPSTPNAITNITIPKDSGGPKKEVLSRKESKREGNVFQNIIHDLSKNNPDYEKSIKEEKGEPEEAIIAANTPTQDKPSKSWIGGFKNVFRGNKTEEKPNTVKTEEKKKGGSFFKNLVNKLSKQPKDEAKNDAGKPERKEPANSQITQVVPVDQIERPDLLPGLPADDVSPNPKYETTSPKSLSAGQKENESRRGTRKDEGGYEVFNSSKENNVLSRNDQGEKPRRRLPSWLANQLSKKDQSEQTNITANQSAAGEESKRDTKAAMKENTVTKSENTTTGEPNTSGKKELDATAQKGKDFKATDKPDLAATSNEKKTEEKKKEKRKFLTGYRGIDARSSRKSKRARINEEVIDGTYKFYSEEERKAEEAAKKAKEAKEAAEKKAKADKKVSAGKSEK